METDKGPPLDKIYQEHVQALQHTNLVTEKIPTLTEQPQHNDEATAPKQVKDNSNNKGNRRLTICFCIVHFDRGSKPVHSIVKTINDKFNLQWLMVSASCQTFANTKEILQWDPSRNSQLDWAPKTLNLYHAIAELEQLVHVATTTCVATRWWSAKSNATTHKMCNRKHTTRSNLECNNISMKCKSLSHSERNRIHAPNILSPDHTMQICLISSNVEAGQLNCAVWSKHVLPKTAQLCAKEKIAILKQSRSNRTLFINPNKEICTCVWSKPPPALIGQSMTKEPAWCTKLPQILPGAMFA